MNKPKSTDSKETVAEAVASPPPSSQPPVEIIIKTGVEGGDWTLFGRKNPATSGWEFAAEVDTMWSSSASKTEWVSDWKSALKLYAKNPWHAFYPLEVHRDFREAVQLALEDQLMHDERLAAQDKNGINLPDWLEVCDEQVQEKILQVVFDDENYYHWTLFGVRDGRGGWHFYTDWSLREEAAVARLTPQNQPLPFSVPTWEAAIEKFDQRAWMKYCATYVHPEFRVRVRSLLIRRKFGMHCDKWQRLMTEGSDSQPEAKQALPC